MPVCQHIIPSYYIYIQLIERNHGAQQDHMLEHFGTKLEEGDAEMIVLVKTFFSNRGRSFPVGAFNKGLTNCKGVSLRFFKRVFCKNGTLKIGAVRTWRNGQMRAGPIEEVAEGEVGDQLHSC